MIGIYGYSSNGMWQIVDLLSITEWTGENDDEYDDYDDGDSDWIHH